MALALLIVALAATVVAAAPPTGTTASAVVAAGSPPARGAARPTRPRAEAFVPGQLPAGTPVALARRTFRADDARAAFPERMDVVFYAKPRPVRVQVKVFTGGKPLAARWEEHLRKLFAVFDRDGDGYLNTYEVDHIFPLDGMRQMFQGNQFYRTGGAAPTLADLDRDGDGRVSFAEFAYFYRDVTADLIKPRSLPAQGTGEDAATAELFARLDADHDGKLIEPELRAAERILLGLDADEDECVSVAELLNNPVRTTSTRVAVATPVGGFRKTETPPPASTSQDVGVFQTGIPGTVVQQLIKHYDKNGDYELTREEVGLDAETFKKLDKNGNGKLAATELDGWRSLPPDAVVELELGDTPAACKATATPTGGKWPKDLTLRQTEHGRLVVRVGSQSIEFAVVALSPDARRQLTERLINGVFPQGAKEVREKDLAGPQNQLLRVIFDDADLNGDGKLTRQEFERYFALQQSTAELGMAMAYSVRTPNLFQMLDENMDGKLGVRELRTAWDRMIVLEPPGATAVTKAILQPNVSLRLTPAAYAVYDPSQFGSRPGQGGRPLRPGPVWFHKMDRNGDGDVSRGEFLGPKEDFDAIDADRDGLISLEEAQAYEKKARPPKEKKSEKK